MALKQATRPHAAAIYVRISEDAEGSHLGVKRQEEDCRVLAEAKGWPVAKVYVDNDVSAYNGRERRQYQQMLVDIADGAVDAVVVWHLDRLHRRPRELEDFFDLADRAGLTSMASVSGDIDLSTDDGRFHARIIGAVARKESDDKSRRVRRKAAELARDGRALGGVTVPFGYTYDQATKKLSPAPKEARIVRRIFEQYAAGVSLRAIMRQLNDKGIVGQRGRTRWSSTSSISKMLSNPSYIGYRHYQGELTKGQWKPLVSQELFDQVQALRLAGKADTPAQNRKGKGKSLLSGLAFCVCGAPMWRDSTSREDEGKVTYICARSARKRRGDCRAGGVSAPRIERHVTDAFLQRVGGAYKERAMKVSADQLNIDTPEDDLEDRLADVERKMARLVDLSLETGLLAQTFRRKAERLEADKASIEKELAKRAASETTTRRRVEDVNALRERIADLPKMWAAGSTEQRNAMLKLAIDRIEVGRGARNKPISITWASWLASS